MAKYRKKPVVIEAEPYRVGLEDGFTDIMGDNGERVQMPFIQTLEGRMLISFGDFIITGIQGERYPCKADIFNATYEAVE